MCNNLLFYCENNTPAHCVAQPQIVLLICYEYDFFYKNLEIIPPIIRNQWIPGIISTTTTTFTTTINVRIMIRTLIVYARILTIGK